MCIDCRDMNTIGENCTLSIDNGDMFIIPSQRKIDKLFPLWREYHLTAKQVYAVVHEDHIEQTLIDLEVPVHGIEWLMNGHSIMFTCNRMEALDIILMKYNGIR